jgi:hypothetical protein
MRPNLKPILFFIYGSVFLFSSLSCNPQAAKSLLSGPDSCVDSVCSQNSKTEITGELSLTQNSTATQNIEQGDLLEVSGTCVDLGRREQRILVQVLPVDDDPAVMPYIDNSISKKCQLNTVGLLTTQQCIFVSLGNGLTEVDSTTGDTRLYPQCVNGKFSFKVRLGTVSKVSGTIKNYLVRTKMRTINPVGETGWNETKVTRKLSAPKFSLISKPQQNICQIRIEPYKFKDAVLAQENIPNILYSIRQQAVGYTATGSQNPAVIPSTPPLRLGGSGFFPFDVTQIDLGDSIANFFDGRTNPFVVLAGTVPVSIQPGVKYNYTVQARAGADDSVLSSSQTCELPIAINIGSSTGLVCSLPLALGSAVPGFLYEWQYSTVPGWTSSNGNGQGFIPCATDPAVPCNFSLAAGSFASGGTYYAAVRTFDGGAFYGKWSNEVACKKP